MRTIILTLVLSTPLLSAEGDWPMWRGPMGDGTTTEKGFPTRWSPKENIVWKTEVPGKGHSSPIIWGDRVFLTTCLENEGEKNEPKERLLLCYDRKTGKELWRVTVLKAKLESIHKLNSFASSTPATDGQRVYVTFLDDPQVVVAAYDFEGKEVWRKTPGKFESKHGFCSPPILYKDLVIVNCDQDAFGKKEPAYIVAFEGKTGEEKWRIDRKNRIRSYCPPLCREINGQSHMVLTGCWTTASYDPNTGKLHWQNRGPTEQFVASLIYQKGLFILTAGFPTYHVVAVRPEDGKIVWEDTKGAGYVPSPVGYGDEVYLVHDNGRASCRDALTGKLHWFEPLGKHHSASPVAVDGKIYFCDDDGITWVVKADKTFEILEKNPLGENIFASPALSRGQIFIRGSKHLFCIGETK